METVMKRRPMQAKTLQDAQIDSFLEKLILLNCLTQKITRLHDIYTVFERCVQNSFAKPAEETWFVKELEPTIGGPVRNLILMLAKDNLVVKVGRGQYSITTQGREFLATAIGLPPHYMSIITSTTSRVDSLLQYDELHPPTIPQSPLYKKYFMPENRTQLNQEMTRLLSCSYFACVQPSIHDPQKEILWIGTFGFKGNRKESLLGNDDIIMEEIAGVTECCIAVDRSPLGKSYGTMGFVGCAKSTRYGVTNAHVLMTAKEECDAAKKQREQKEVELELIAKKSEDKLNTSNQSTQDKSYLISQKISTQSLKDETVQMPFITTKPEDKLNTSNQSTQDKILLSSS